MGRIILLLLLVATVLRAETLYVSQSGSGGGTGADASNRASLAWLNNASNWGSGAGKVSAGDTVSLSGTFTTQLVIAGSGSTGNPVTILFESGSSFSAARWGIDSAAAIYSSGKSYITIDGNSVGIVENTDNGDSPLTNQLTSRGIAIVGGSNWEIKNLIVRNLFVKTYNSATVLGNYSTRGVDAVGCSSISVNHCTFSHAHTGVFISGACSTVDASNNVITTCSTAIVIATSTGEAMTGVTTKRNDITMGYNWTDPAGNAHNDGIHIFAAGGGTMSGVDMSANYCHGNPGEHSTAMFYWEGLVDNVSCYNNVGIASVNGCTDGYITASGSSGLTALIQNNTIVGVATDNTGGNGLLVYVGSGSYAVTVQNNIFSNCFTGIYNGVGTVSWTCDYNDYSVGSVGVGNGDVFKSSLASWQSYSGGDSHSFTSSPLLDGTYRLTTGSPAIGTGTDLSAYFTTDKDGTTRTAPWDIGAYKSNTTAPVTSPVVGKRSGRAAIAGGGGL